MKEKIKLRIRMRKTRIKSQIIKSSLKRKKRLKRKNEGNLYMRECYRAL